MHHYMNLITGPGTCVGWVEKVWISKLLKSLYILLLHATLFWANVGRMPGLSFQMGGSEFRDWFVYC